MTLFLFFPVTDDFKWFWMESLHKNIQLMLVLKVPFLVKVPFCHIAIYADFKCVQASNLWKQLELASELEPDLGDTVDWGKKWLIDFSAGEIQLVLFDRSNNNGFIDVKMDASVLEEKF